MLDIVVKKFSLRREQYTVCKQCVSKRTNPQVGTCSRVRAMERFKKAINRDLELFFSQQAVFHVVPQAHWIGIKQSLKQLKISSVNTLWCVCVSQVKCHQTVGAGRREGPHTVGFLRDDSETPQLHPCQTCEMILYASSRIP